MGDQRFLEAIARVETAIARVEAAIDALPDAADGVPDLATVDLLERHARLRSGAGEALARLDRLLASRED